MFTHRRQSSSQIGQEQGAQSGRLHSVCGLWQKLDILLDLVLGHHVSMTECQTNGHRKKRTHQWHDFDHYHQHKSLAIFVIYLQTHKSIQTQRLYICSSEMIEHQVMRWGFNLTRAASRHDWNSFCWFFRRDSARHRLNPVNICTQSPAYTYFTYGDQQQTHTYIHLMHTWAFFCGVRNQLTVSPKSHTPARTFV